MEDWIVGAYRYVKRNWNVIVASISLTCMAVFWIIIPLREYVPLFAFAVANAVVWTVIELKVNLAPAVGRELVHPNMRSARGTIIRDIEDGLRGTTASRPLQLTMVGGRLRSMSDIVRELMDDLRQGRVEGHVRVAIQCLDPEFVASRILPGQLSVQDQKRRNQSYASLVRSLAVELEGLALSKDSRSTLRVATEYYATDPQYYAYMIGDSVLHWGPYTWSEEKADFIGPENFCVRLNPESPNFQGVREWLLNRSQLTAAEHRVQYAKGVGKT
ncbi:hypothetical protein [Amycolatopsis sp. w19]|uniref:hypothetical protein n=1 Tax=Amycolatopsis sp. w19 TaxID=3448134 RepID=UPI003F1DD9ED